MHEESIEKLKAEKNNMIDYLTSEKENLTNELEAKREELHWLNAERAVLRVQNKELKSVSNHFEKLYREVYAQYYELAIARYSLNWFCCGCLAVSFYLAYRGLRPSKTDLPDLPPKKFNLLENFFLTFFVKLILQLHQLQLEKQFL